MSFEEDIPGVECRPENAKKRLLEEAGGSEGVTLDEEVKKDLEAKSGAKQVKRRRSTAAKNKVVEEAEGEDGPKPKKRGRKKKEEEDEEYVPEAEKKKKSPKNELADVKPVPKSNIIEQAVKEATLDEI